VVLPAGTPLSCDALGTGKLFVNYKGERKQWPQEVLMIVNHSKRKSRGENRSTRKGIEIK